MEKHSTAIVIGVTGHPAAGKDLASGFFVSKGLAHISIGDFLRERMKELNIPTDRPHIREFAKEMRAKHGNQYPVDLIAREIKEDVVVSGFRNAAEVAIFRNRFGKRFTLIAVDAPLKVRFERLYGRGRHGDQISFEQFKEEEERERREASGSHEMDAVIEQADLTVVNDGTKEEFFAKLEPIFEKLGDMG